MTPHASAMSIISSRIVLFPPDWINGDLTKRRNGPSGKKWRNCVKWTQKCYPTGSHASIASPRDPIDNYYQKKKSVTGSYLVRNRLVERSSRLIEWNIYIILMGDRFLSFSDNWDTTGGWGVTQWPGLLCGWRTIHVLWWIMRFWIMTHVGKKKLFLSSRSSAGK